MRKFLLFLLINSFAWFIHAGNDKTYLFVGTYTDGKPDTGIYVFEFDTTTGILKKTHEINEVVNPSFLDVSPNGKLLIVCTDTKLPQNGTITSYAFDNKTGKLSFINKITSGGYNPIYVAVDATNNFAGFGNYGGGSFSISKINKEGKLQPYKNLYEFTDSSINKERQEKSHVHATVFSPNNKFLFITDLGADKIRTYLFNKNKKTTLSNAENLLIQTKPGSGPRHLVFHPNLNMAYCIEELSGTIALYSYKEGKLNFTERIFACSETKEVYSSADIHISPDGLFLYASNRGENTIAIFSINQSNGTLKLLAHEPTYGNTPRNFTIDPSGNFLLVANQLSNNIIVFRRNLVTGLLTKTDNIISIPNPSCLKMKSY